MSDVARFIIIIAGLGVMIGLIKTTWQGSVRWVDRQGMALGFSHRWRQVWSVLTSILGPIGSALFFLLFPKTGTKPQFHSNSNLPTDRFEEKTLPKEDTSTIPPDSEYDLVVVGNQNGKGLKIGKRYSLVDGIHSIGRHPTPEPKVVAISLDDRAISRNHLYIETAPNGIFTVTDRSSAHGTRLNGQKLEPDTPYPFNVGDILQIGNTRFELVRDGRATSVAQKPIQKQFQLRVIDGNDKGKIFNPSKKRKATIGRSTTADWQLSDDKISRQHAEIKQEGKQFIIRDLNSTHGIFVNDKQIETRELVPGDTIRLGDTTLIFEVA